MEKIIVKIGSSLIAPNGKLNRRLLSEFARDIVLIRQQGYAAIIVSSGAIACGAQKANLKKRPADEHSLMALASLGQIVLMDAWSKVFKKYRKNCAQILLSWDDFDHRKRFINARVTLDKLLAMGVVPIINENDAISCEEIKFGDNDRLGALAADLTGARLLIILSDVDGLLDKNKKTISTVAKIDSSIASLVSAKNGKFTSGGMITKLQAAKIITSAGGKMIIANGKIKNVLSRLIGGENIGTCFLPVNRVTDAHKRWIAFSKKIKGTITVNDTAKDFLIFKNKSLLRRGITAVSGDFKKYDSVRIVDKCGRILGRGLTQYSIEEISVCLKKNFEQEVIRGNNFVKCEEI